MSISNAMRRSTIIERMNNDRYQGSLFDDSLEYDAFKDKFAPKLTTDDCYTPGPIYDALASYVSSKYCISKDFFIRPFFPDSDYMDFDYPEGSVVVDNPPFSSISQIAKYYVERGIKFFLFAPALTVFSCSRQCTAIGVGVGITYENGAEINTSFITNLEDPSIRFKSDPELFRVIKKANEENQKVKKRTTPKYKYPDHIVTAAMLNRFSGQGVNFSVSKSESMFLNYLEDQKRAGKTIFGGGYLVSERAAAERAIEWDLSEREKEYIEIMSKKREES